MGRVSEPSRKVTPAELRQRVFFGLIKPLLYRGRYVTTVQKGDNSALLRHLAQVDRGGNGLDLNDPALWRFTPRSASTSQDRERVFLPERARGG